MARNINNKGRSTLKKNNFIALERYIIKSDAYRDLSSGARALLIEIMHRFNGENNGEIRLSCLEAGKAINASEATASRRFKELYFHGFIKPCKKGHFTGRMATEWILCTEAYKGNLPTKEFMRWPVLEIRVEDYA